MEVTDSVTAPLPAPTVLTHGHDDAVPRINDFLCFDRDAGPGLEKASCVLRQAFEAEVGPGIGELGRMTNSTRGSNSSTLAAKSPLLHRS